MMPLNKVSTQVFSGVKWTSTSAIVKAICKLLQIVVLTRFLSKEEFGLVAIALLVNSFCNIFTDMGITAAVLHKKEITKYEYSSLYWFNIVSGVLLTLLASTFSESISAYYLQPELTKIIPLTAINIFLLSVSGLQRTVQQKKMNFKFISLVEIVAVTLMLLFSIYFAINGYGIYSLVYSTLIESCIIAMIYLLYGLFVERNIKLHCKTKEIITFLEIGVFQVGTSIFDFFSRELDILIIGSVYSMEFLGAYTLCKQIGMRIYALINPIITKILTPTLALYQDNKSTLKHNYVNVLKGLSFINYPIYFIVAVNSSYILLLLYGKSYVEYGGILSIVALNYAILSMGNPVGSLIVATGKTNLGFYWTIFRITISVIVMWIASFFSIYMFVLSILFMNVFNIYPAWLIIYRKIINISFKEILFLYMKPYFLCLILGIALFFLNIENIYFSFFFKTLVFGVLYLMIFYKMNEETFLKVYKQFR